MSSTIHPDLSLIKGVYKIRFMRLYGWQSGITPPALRLSLARGALCPFLLRCLKVCWWRRLLNDAYALAKLSDRICYHAGSCLLAVRLPLVTHADYESVPI